jgi:anti-sigma factor ChrR (cupin superfamily)
MIAKQAMELANLTSIETWQDQLAWQPFHPGIEIYQLYEPQQDGSQAALLRYLPRASVPLHEHPVFEHILVLSGEQSDENGTYAAGSLVINPPGSRHSVISKTGCIVLLIWEKPVIRC